MKRYEEYKDTGIGWIPELPHNWDTKKISSLFDERRTKVSDKDYAPLSVSNSGITPQLETAVKSDNGDNRKLVVAGDFVVNSRSDRKGSCGISPLTGSVSLINIVLHPRREINGNYFHYLSRSNNYIEEYYRLGRGIVADLWTTRYSELKSIYIPYPPLAEQEKIVKFLESKTLCIDAYVAERERELQLLNELKESEIANIITRGLNPDVKMKDSGIFWQPRVPEHWNVTRLKYVITKLSRERRPEDELLVCSNSGEVRKRGESKLGLVANSDEIYQGVRKGDLLIHGMDTWHGAIAVSMYDGMCTPVVHVCDSTQEKEYIALYLRNMAAQKIFKLISNGVRQNTSDFRSWDKLARIPIPVPPITEQRDIIAYVSDKCNKVNSLITELEGEIEYLKEYKQKLIADCVTGKINVQSEI